MLGNSSWLHILGHCCVHQPCSIHVHLQPVAGSKAPHLGRGRGAEAGRDPGAASANMSYVQSSLVSP